MVNLVQHLTPSAVSELADNPPGLVRDLLAAAASELRRMQDLIGSGDRLGNPDDRAVLEARIGAADCLRAFAALPQTCEATLRKEPRR
jgi:hypothetical protein